MRIKLPDGAVVVPSAAQKRVIEDARARVAADAALRTAHDKNCSGCIVFGLCALHAPSKEETDP